MKNWYSIHHDATTGTATVFLRDDIGCYGRSSGDLGRELAALSPERLDLQIDSTGGNSISGENLHQIFSSFPCEALIYGRCCSAAMVAALAAKKITILSSAKILIHSPCTYVHGNEAELLVAAGEIRDLRNVAAQLFKARTGQPIETINEWLSKDTWFTAQEALALGIVDEITEPVVSRRSAPQKQGTPAIVSVPESERLFSDWLAAFGRVEVQSRENFLNALVYWARTNTYEQQ